MNKSANNENAIFEQMFENTAIMTIKDNENVVWFKAQDVCGILEYINERQSIRRHVPESDKITWKDLKLMGLKNSRIKITYQTVFINESGVNALVMKSKKPNAKKFQHWITSEVVPQLRKHGFYVHKKHVSSALPHEDGYAYFSDLSVVSDTMREKFLVQPNVFKNRVDIKNKDEVMKVMERNDNIDFTDYDGDQVIYLYMTSIKNVNDNRLICKVGFATDLQQRHLQLIDNDYKSEFHIIGVKRCNRISDETRFHRIFKKNYRNLNYKCKIGTKGKDELYYFDTKLIKFWDKFKISQPGCETCEGIQMVHEIEKEIYFTNVERVLWLKDQQLKLKQDTIEALESMLKFERICRKIDNILINVRN
jgi:prophage antirepressor-like protein